MAEFVLIFLLKGNDMRSLLIAGLGLCLILSTTCPVYAGEYEKIRNGEAGAPDGGDGVAEGVVGVYRFTDCVEPPEPEGSSVLRANGSRRLLTRAEAVRRHNAHVEAVNAYFQCLSDEAERDISAHYKAVSAALDARQTETLNRLNARADALNRLPLDRLSRSGRGLDVAPRSGGQRGLDLAPTSPPVLDEQLLGGSDNDE